MSTNHLLPLSSKWETNFTPLKMWVVYYIQWRTFDKQNWWNWLRLTSRTSPRTRHFCLALSWFLLFREAGSHVVSTLEQPVKRPLGGELSFPQQLVQLVSHPCAREFLQENSSALANHELTVPLDDALIITSERTKSEPARLAGPEVLTHKNWVINIYGGFKSLRFRVIC